MSSSKGPSSRTCIRCGGTSGYTDARIAFYPFARLRARSFLGQPRTELTETLDLDIVRIEHPVWTRGTAYPPPDSHVLSVPFSFALPDSAPPSYQFSRLDCQSVVRYLIEAVGVRLGTLRMNKRVVQPIAVLPVDRIGARVRERLGRGWTGKWTSAAAEKTVRTSLWGGSARAEMTVRYETFILR